MVSSVEMSEAPLCCFLVTLAYLLELTSDPSKLRSRVFILYGFHTHGSINLKDPTLKISGELNFLVLQIIGKTGGGFRKRDSFLVEPLCLSMKNIYHLAVFATFGIANGCLLENAFP